MPNWWRMEDGQIGGGQDVDMMPIIGGGQDVDMMPIIACLGAGHLAAALRGPAHGHAASADSSYHGVRWL